MTDTQILDWLSMKVVNVRDPLRYGSRDMFWASPVDDDGWLDEPSNLREQVINQNVGGVS